MFIGSFIGGGLVLNGSLYPGRTGNAGAIGSMPIARPGEDGTGNPAADRLRLDLGSGEEAACGRPRRLMLWRSPTIGRISARSPDEWIEGVAQSLALAVTAAISVLDFEAVIIDGSCPAAVRARIVERTTARLATIDRQGLSPVTLSEGSIGGGARAIGGACLPLLARFGRDQDVLLKDNGTPAADRLTAGGPNGRLARKRA